MGGGDAGGVTVGHAGAISAPVAPMMTLVGALLRPLMLNAIGGVPSGQVFCRDLEAILGPILAILMQTLRLATADERLENFVIDST
ncbi:hypothetical protein CYMTET_25207, partial [Cymbomonas tetramitiformis]